MKKILVLILITIITTLTSGCFSRDLMEGITIYSTSYPVTFLANELYGYNSTVKSVYPKGVDPKTYVISDKKIKDYAKESSLFIYNGHTNEKEMAAKFLKYNKNIRIIDVSQGLKEKPYVEELWIAPSNYLMLALNIKNGLKEYIDNQFIHEEIEENYEKIKVSISKIEAELKVISELGDDNTLVIDNDALLYLKKYGFNVISVDTTQNNIPELTTNNVKRLIKDGILTSIILLDSYKENELVRDIIANTKVNLAPIITKNYLLENDDNINYFDIMQNNLEIIRKEVAN